MDQPAPQDPAAADLASDLAPSVRLLPVAVCFGLAGLADAAMTLSAGTVADGRSMPALCATIVGLWLAAAVGVSLVEKAVLAGVGRRGAADVLSAVTSWWTECLAGGDEDADRRRALRLIALLAGGAVLVLSSIAWLSHLIDTRHGALLIALTFVVGQIALAVASGIVALGVHRVARRTIRIKTRTLLVLVGLGAAVGLVYGLVAFRETIQQTDASSLLLIATAIGLQPLAHRLVTRRFDGVRASAGVIAFACLSLGLGALDRGSRGAVAQGSGTAKYLLDMVQRLSDADGDGSPWLPGFDDCAPFDANIHPFAVEIPGNGVDEDCDGFDGPAPGPDGEAVASGLPAAFSVPRPPPLDRQGPPPNLVLITIDALRADHVGAYGYVRPTTPNLDAVARRAVLFERAYAQDSGTGPSLWSLMAGKTPFQVKLEHASRFPPNYAESEITLATHLSRAGYQTAAVLCGHVFSVPWWTLRRGFGSYEEICGKDDKHKAPAVTRKALATLASFDPQRPYFLWVHYYDPHGPYYNSSDVDFGHEKKDRYDEEIAYTDRYVGRLLDMVGTRQHGRATYTAITADHGEAFGEHGPDPHARTLYVEVTRVPLILLGPDVTPRKVAAPVAVGDLFPTFLDLAGAPIPETTTMVSQGHVLFGAEPDMERLVFQENSYARPRRDVKGVVGKRYHLIVDTTHGTRELYDLQADRREMTNLHGTDRPEAARLEAAMRGFIPTTHVPRDLSK